MSPEDRVGGGGIITHRTDQQQADAHAAQAGASSPAYLNVPSPYASLVRSRSSRTHASTARRTSSRRPLSQVLNTP